VLLCDNVSAIIVYVKIARIISSARSPPCHFGPETGKVSLKKTGARVALFTRPSRGGSGTGSCGSLGQAFDIIDDGVLPAGGGH
jgi:hypothetical protein